MIAVVAWIAIGIGVIAVIAVIVGIVDAANAAVWRQVARERRRRWESRFPEYQSGSWEDD